jgi:hypothetical protein
MCWTYTVSGGALVIAGSWRLGYGLSLALVDLLGIASFECINYKNVLHIYTERLVDLSKINGDFLGSGIRISWFRLLACCGIASGSFKLRAELEVLKTFSLRSAWSNFSNQYRSTKMILRNSVKCEYLIFSLIEEDEDRGNIRGYIAFCRLTAECHSNASTYAHAYALRTVAKSPLGKKN